MLYVIDDFLDDSPLSRNIQQSNDFFPQLLEGNNLGEKANLYHSNWPFMFWDGWWKSPANTLKKKLIQKIWSTPMFQFYKPNEICGFEYWTRTFTKGQYLAAHVDEDTFAYQRNQKFNAPAVGCVWYGFTETPGDGFLELHPHVIEGNPTGALEHEEIVKVSSPIEQRERICYKPNRLIVFQAGRRIHETTPVLSGERHVLIVNVWLNSSPPEGLTMGKFVHE